MGGAEIFLDLLLREQNKSDTHKPAVAVVTKNKTPTDTPYPLFPIYPSRLGFLDFRKSLNALKTAINRFKPDLIHCHYGYPSGALVRKLDLPWVITSHGGDIYPHSHHRQKKKHWKEITASYTEANAVITISPFVTRVMEKELKVEPTRLHAIPNGIDPTPLIIPISFL